MKAVALIPLLILICSCSAKPIVVKTEITTYPYGDSYLLKAVEIEHFSLKGKTPRQVISHTIKLRAALNRCNINTKTMSELLIKHNKAIEGGYPP